MVLNYTWLFFFLIAFLVALVKFILYLCGMPDYGGETIFREVVDAIFTSAKTGFEVSLGLTGVITFWMGLIRVGEKAGAVNFLARAAGPFFRKIFPGVPKDHPAIGHITLNFSANLLGVGNSATPIGLKAMNSLQELNPDKESASDAQIMFLVLNTAGFTLIPVTIMSFRAQYQAAQGLPIDPTDVFVPILIASYCAMLVGVLATAVRQKILDLKLSLGLALTTAVMTGIVWGFSAMAPATRSQVSSVSGNIILFGIIIAFLLAGAFKKNNIYADFIEGAKEGFTTAVKIIPYLVAMLAGIGVFRACGAMDYLVQGIAWCVAHAGLNTDFVGSLPVAFMKPLSGGGTQGLAVEAMKHFGVNSFTGRLSSVIYASADTTFYIVALYFGSVGIKRTRYAIGAGLIADLAGIIAAILVAYLFFH